MLWCLIAAAAAIQPPEAVRVAWLRDQVAGNLQVVVERAKNGTIGPGSRAVADGALAALVLAKAPGSDGRTPEGACRTAEGLLRLFGDRYSMSFGGQVLPLVVRSYEDCWNVSTREWILGVVNRSLPMTQQEATPQEVAYTNMWLMATVDSLLFGEVAGGARGAVAVRVGEAMLHAWANHTNAGGIHEFTSPTYTYVQLAALYTGYIATQGETRALIGRALDLVWADTAANSFQGHLGGAHSRDYDFLHGRGMLLIEMYLWGLPGSVPLTCAHLDPHCEGPTAGSAPGVGTGEPMTVLAISLYNYLHPRGYRPPAHLLALPGRTPRVVRHRFLQPSVTANGQFARFADTYNFVSHGFSLGSASQDYVCNTAHKYFPNPQSKLINAILAPANATYRGRAVPAVTVVPDWMKQPYGKWARYPLKMEKASHLALHPGCVQHRGVLLASLALDGADTLDGFTTEPTGNLYRSLATNVILPRAAESVTIRCPGAVAAERFVLPATPFRRVIELGCAVAIRVGPAALAVRVFALDGAGAQQPSLALEGDALGMDLGAVVLRATHYEGRLANLTDDRHVRWAALIVADDGAGATAAAVAARAAAADLRSTTGHGRWETRAALPGTPELAVERNLTCAERGEPGQSVHTTWNCLLSRTVGGRPIVPAALTVDGARVVAPLKNGLQLEDVVGVERR